MVARATTISPTRVIGTSAVRACESQPASSTVSGTPYLMGSRWDAFAAGRAASFAEGVALVPVRERGGLEPLAWGV
jgi:hypothetical protein